MKTRLLAALVLIGGYAFLTAQATAAPDAPGSTSLPTEPALLSVVTAVGDDTFATVDLTNVLDPSGPTQH
jgi:hypothetical protein